VDTSPYPNKENRNNHISVVFFDSHHSENMYALMKALCWSIFYIVTWDEYTTEMWVLLVLMTWMLRYASLFFSLINSCNSYRISQDTYFYNHYCLCSYSLGFLFRPNIKKGGTFSQRTKLSRWVSFFLRIHFTCLKSVSLAFGQASWKWLLKRADLSRL